ncbi:hypothetical protein D3C74_318900 [compost metagenome]
MQPRRSLIRIFLPFSFRFRQHLDLMFDMRRQIADIKFHERPNRIFAWRGRRPCPHSAAREHKLDKSTVHLAFGRSPHRKPRIGERKAGWYVARLACHDWPVQPAKLSCRPPISRSVAFCRIELNRSTDRICVGQLFEQSLPVNFSYRCKTSTARMIVAEHIIEQT